MPAEHLNEHGKLCQGYYCGVCGKGSGMYGHTGGHRTCASNPKLVKKLDEINRAGSIEAYVFNKLKETDA